MTGEILDSIIDLPASGIIFVLRSSRVPAKIGLRHWAVVVHRRHVTSRRTVAMPTASGGECDHSFRPRSPAFASLPRKGNGDGWILAVVGDSARPAPGRSARFRDRQLAAPG